MKPLTQNRICRYEITPCFILSAICENCGGQVEWREGTKIVFHVGGRGKNCSRKMNQHLSLFAKNGN